MRTHQASQKKTSAQKSNAPTSNPLASRPFAVQPKPEEQARSALRSSASLSPETKGYESTLSEFAILNPEGGRSLPVQPKLAIGQVGDKYEQEADQVAQQVVQRLNTPQSPQLQKQPLQRQEMPEEEEKLQMKPEFTLQRQTNPGEEDELQMKPMLQRQGGQSGMAATPKLESSIQRLRGSGQPLADTIREPMERAFGADFSGVKVHTDAQSDQLNQSIQAKAFTTGQDIFFRQGEYDPENRKELIAHELTHVVQQGAANTVAKKSIKTSATSSKETIQRAEDQQKKNNEVESKTQASGGNPTQKIFLCGHGSFDFNNQFFKLPENTTVTFYTLHAKKMHREDSFAIMRGEYKGQPERVVETGESCPNMTLHPENNDEEKQWNEEQAQVAREGGHDMIQVNANENLQEIISKRGPGYNYVWNCCFDYSNLKENSSPVGRLSMGGSNDQSLGYAPGYENKVRNIDNINNRYERIGEVGEWKEKEKMARHKNIEGRIEVAEIQTLGKWISIEIDRTNEKTDSQYSGYKIFIRTEDLSKVYSPGYLKQEKGNSLKLLVRTLKGKNISIKQADTFDQSRRLLIIRNAAHFSISD